MLKYSSHESRWLKEFEVYFYSTGFPIPEYALSFACAKQNKNKPQTLSDILKIAKKPCLGPEGGMVYYFAPLSAI